MALSALTDRVGIRPEAMRVALHRLRKDQWIVARKAGRNSLYRLSAQGLAETQRASTRIYAQKIERPDLWHLVVANPALAVFPASVNVLIKSADYLKISGNIVLGAGSAPSLPNEVLVLEFTRMAAPAWLLDHTRGEETYKRIAALLSGTADALDLVRPIPALDQVTIRLLVIHHWRRAVLRHSPLIDMLHGDDWVGSECRAVMSKILERLPSQDFDTLIVEGRTTV